MKSIYKRELGSYFQGMMAYVFCAFLLLFAGIYVMAFNLQQKYSNFEYVLSYLSFLLIFAIPLLTMRVFAEEKKQKTDQLLYSLPLSITQIVLGKYLSLASVILLPCVIMGCYPLILGTLGPVNYLTAYTALLAFYCLALALASIGMLISALCDNQTVASVICLMILFLLYYSADFATYVTASLQGTLLVFGGVMALVGIFVSITTKNIWNGVIVAAVGETICSFFSMYRQPEFSQLLVTSLKQIAVFRMFFTFVDGMLDLTVIFYYLSIMVLMIFVTIQALKKRRWDG